MRPIFPFCFQIFLEDEEHEPVQKKITKQNQTNDSADSNVIAFPVANSKIRKR